MSKTSYLCSSVSLNKLQLIIRVFLSSGVFVSIWSLLTVPAPALVDNQAVFKWLGESDWLKFLNPDIRNVLVIQGWQPLAALILAVLSYRSIKAPADYIANKICPPKTYVLSDDAKAIIKALHRPDYIRRKAGLSRELGIDEEDVSEGLSQLLSNGLVIERKKRTGLFWKITFEGQNYLDQFGDNHQIKKDE